MTQTGQPGPDNSFTSLGKVDLIPLRKMETVWVPQTSIMLICRPGVLQAESIIFRAL
jgi:hypothetical protein